MPFVELVTQASNVPAQRVITHHGGELVERFTNPDTHAGAESLRYRIHLR